MLRVTDKHVFFWSGFPSNWYPSEFTAKYEGKEYKFHNTEQYFMFVKAKTFGDEEIAMRILLEGEDPKQAKTLGRMVRNYDDKVWEGKRYQVMLDANYLKYTDSEELQAMLLDEKYKGKEFVEASPIDRIWGIGLHQNDPLVDDESNWRGQNLLGKVLNEVRARIIAEKES